VDLKLGVQSLFPTATRSILHRHGFWDISMEEVTHRVEFPTFAAFHEWSWSTGWRATWAAIPAEHRDAAKAAVDDYLRSLSDRRGSLWLATAVGYTRAHLGAGRHSVRGRS
jgi:hypothetical protein